jgi:phosphoesterase RecJ-like protein
MSSNPTDIDARPAGTDVGPAEIAARLTQGPLKLAIATHRNPDGDAIGTMLGLTRALRAAGHDVVMHHPDLHPIPDEFAFLVADGELVATGPPHADEQRILIAVDCASEGRLWTDEDPHAGVVEVFNIDHHHDNTRFGDLNLIEPQASSSAEVVVHVLEAAGLPITKDVGEPLYVGLLTDTGRFCYSNTGVEAHRIAGVLLAAGVDPHEAAKHLYEEQPESRLRLLGRAAEKATTLCDGRLMLAALGPDDFHAAGGDDTEGIVEAMRSVKGVEVAGLARQAGHKGWRVSLRSGDGEPDVSAIAREHGGGGHRSAAGFSTGMPVDELFAWIEARVAGHFAGER